MNQRKLEDVMSIELDWSNLSPQDLDSIVERAKQEKEAQREQRMVDLREIAETIKREVESLGVSLPDLFGLPVPAKVATVKREKLPPKFVHPEYANRTWSGRGKKPMWLQDLLDKGTTLESLRIKPQPEAVQTEQAVDLLG